MSGLSTKDTLEAMIAGTHEDEIIEDEGVNEEDVEDVEEESTEEVEETEQETTETEEDEDVEDIEDTDLEDEPAEEDETEGGDDDSDQETSETEEESQEENTQDDEASEDESENTKEELSEDERYMYNGVNTKEFFEKVALAKFTANGKEVEGFKDPEDLIRAQQMLHGYSDKMKVFKEYKPFIKALQERDLTKDSDKFNLAMSLLDGDTEAIKKVLKDQKIDPLDLDLEDIKYAPKNVLPSETQLVIEDAYEQAENLGVADKFSKVVSNDWDVASLQELVSNGAVRNDLMQHLQDGTYDNVQNEINRMELLDSTGKFNSMSSVDKYRIAIGRINEANQKAASETVVEDKVENKVKVPTIDEKQAEEFKQKAKAKKEAKAAEARKRAASLSKKRVVKKSKSEPKLEELKGEDFRKAFQNMLMG